MNVIKLFDRSPTYLGTRISQSPRRASAEPEIERDFNRVRTNFENSKGKLRDHWYKGNLRDLARVLNLEAEYEIFQKLLSGVVHSSSYALQEGMPIQDFLLMDWAWRFSFRILGKFAAYAQVSLNEKETYFIRSSQENVFGDP